MRISGVVRMGHMAEKIAYFRLGKMWDPAFKDERFYIIKNAHPS